MVIAIVILALSIVYLWYKLNKITKFYDKNFKGYNDDFDKITKWMQDHDSK